MSIKYRFLLSCIFICALESLSLPDFRKPTDSKETAPPQTEERKYLPGIFLLSARQDIGSGVGYHSGYTTLEELVFTNLSKNLYPFLDFRAHRLLNDTYAANVGMGMRIFSESLCRVFGFNTYYDYRNIHHSHFNQLGVGFELLSSRCNIRLNSYFPIGKKRGLICSNFDTSNGFFLLRKNYQVALKGFNLEGEVLLGKLNPTNFFFYALGGPYYYKNDCKDVIGGLLGFSVKYKQILFLQISGTCDSIFKTRMQGTIGLTLPLGNIPKRKTSSCLLSEMIILDAVKRNEMIVLDRHCTWKWNY